MKSVRANPIFVMMLGLCPALAITTTVANALAMGVSVIFVLAASSVALSLLRRTLPPSLSPYSEMVIIAVFVTVVEVLMTRFVPGVADALGIYLPLIAVNCIILNQAKGSALKKTAGEATVDALVVGIGFLGSLSLVAIIRESLGAGTITLFPFGTFGGVLRLGDFADSPAGIMVLPVGAFLVVGYLMAAFNVAKRLQGNRRRRVRHSAQTATMKEATGGRLS